MCGLAGFMRGPATPSREGHKGWLETMGAAIRHRGPDAGATWLDEEIGLVHRRLSILDLSDAGTQPMISASGRHVIVFNGEIYNFRAIRQLLLEKGVHFRTGTDTEVLLELFEREGADCLAQLNGMFAFAIWDRQAKSLFLARDRLGKKPLYYYQRDGEFAFASEIKALHPLPFVDTTLRPDALKDFFFYQYVPDPKSIYQSVHKLPPAHWLKLADGEVTIKAYWDLTFANQSTSDEHELQAALRQHLGEAVEQRLVSDVPLGAFLSGGVDSSAVVSLMAGTSSRPVTTCAIGFDSEKYDEVHYARRVAEQFGTNHHEFTVREQVAESLPAIARYFDEPFADPSFVPTYFVSRLARQQVTVALAGDGGDENFAGYGKYAVDARENQLRRLFPAMVRQRMFPALGVMAGKIPHGLGRRARSLLTSLAQDPATAFYQSNRFCDPAVWNRIITPELQRATAGYDPADITRAHYHNADAEDHLSRILYADFKTYLPGDILVKVDRMSMANSLETRAPLLDYRFVEFAASVPSSYKLRGAEKKYLLKKAFEGQLPHDILYRKKMGFSVPLAHWLRHEIRPLAEPLLTSQESPLARFFRMDVVTDLWQTHLAGQDRYTQELWTLLALALWQQQYPH
jgi:asparagine synthase (glutamine-hydrolysing)